MWIRGYLVVRNYPSEVTIRKIVHTIETIGSVPDLKIKRRRHPSRSVNNIQVVQENTAENVVFWKKFIEHQRNLKMAPFEKKIFRSTSSQDSSDTADYE